MAIEHETDLAKADILIAGQKLLPGFVGGIGPLSHTDFERLYLQLNSTASRDQDHPVYNLISATSIPDRTVAIKQEQSGSSALAQEVEDKIVYFVNQLAGNGCDFAVLICNTSHFWHERVREKIKIPWLHMMRVTAKMIKEDFPKVQKVGILATDGTLMTGLYHDALKGLGLEAIAQDVGTPIQQKVMAAIYDPFIGIKATKDRVDRQATANLVEAANDLKQKGAEVVIAGCTEISVALPGAYHAIPVVDPMRCLAQTALDLAMGRRQHAEFV